MWKFDNHGLWRLLLGQVVCGDHIFHTGLSWDSHAPTSGLSVADYKTTLKKKTITGYQPLRKSNGILLIRDELRTHKSRFPET